MDIPKCCGKKMDVEVETSSFYEIKCSSCGDRVFMKKDSAHKPQLIDD